MSQRLAFLLELLQISNLHDCLLISLLRFGQWSEDFEGDTVNEVYVQCHLSDQLQ